jgi:hypothetical protein
MARAAEAKKIESKWPEPLSKKLWPSIDKKKIWPLAKIKPYPHNPKTHPPAQITLLAQILRTYGPDQDIVVDEAGVILKGHGRHLAAAEAELDGYPVTQRLGLSDSDKVAMRISDNQIPLLGGWNAELIRFEMMKLQGTDYPIKLLGFGDAELVQFTTTPQPPAEFAPVGEDIPTEFCCPRCRYVWSGNPTAGKIEDPPPAAKKKK